MLIQLASVVLAQSAPPVIAVADRIVRPAIAVPQTPVENLAVRISSPEGILWQGTLRVSTNQGASYQQNFSQAAPDVCPPGSPYDRSERRHVNLNLYAQNNPPAGQMYRIDVSWGRPVRDPNCGESGTRTVQVNQSVALERGETAVIEGDAGLKVELTRAH